MSYQYPPQKIRFLQLFWAIVLISLAFALKVPDLERQNALLASPIEPSSQTSKQDSSILKSNQLPLDPANPAKYEGELLSGSLVGSIFMFILMSLSILWLSHNITRFNNASSGYYCFSNEQFIALLLAFLAGFLALMFLALGIQLLFMAIVGKRIFSSPLENIIRYSNNVQYCDKQMENPEQREEWAKKREKSQLKLDKSLLNIPTHISKTINKIARLERKTARPNIFRPKFRTQQYLEEIEFLKKELKAYKLLKEIDISEKEAMMNLIDLIESNYEARPYNYFQRSRMRQRERQLFK